MGLRITAVVERWPVAGAFVIARGAKTYVDVVVAAISSGGMIGMGEGTPIYYRGENAGDCLKQIELTRESLEEAETPQAARLALQDMLPAGAARNALDCAFWDLEAKLAGQTLSHYAGLPDAKPLTTAFTISLGDADQMEADAKEAAAKGYSLLKLKLTGEGDRGRVTAVHRGAPEARLVVDANESWWKLDIAAEADALFTLGVEMIEQPLPAGLDAKLNRNAITQPIVADESCHTAADIQHLAAHYDGVNIKLDKAGGLTEALKILQAARAHEMKVMVGCMLSTSLGVAPAFALAQLADWVDLDGPALLTHDREGGFCFVDGMISASKE